MSVKASAATFKKIGANFLKLSGKAAGTTRELIDVLLDLFNTLRKNSKNLKPLLDDILDYIRDMAGLVTRQVTDFFATFGLTLKKVKQPALYSGIPIPVGDDLYALSKNGKEIFRGTKKEIDELAEKLRKMSDEDARKYVDDLVKGNKLKLAKQMWKEFEYKHLMEIPPTKKPCFLAGTLVKTENGHIPIEQLKVGDKVFTNNLEKKQTEINAVTRVYENVTQKYLKITTKNSCIEATGQHRFWIPKQEKWLMANELKTGMHFLDTNNNLVEILNLEIIENTEKTFNLEIENNHNYYVGQDEILTHNTNKVFKFADETLYDFGFYELVKGKGADDVLYVGITTQPFDVRNSQHAQEGKAASKYNKPYNAWKANPKMGILPIEPHFKMTFYEATIWETYFINERGGGKAHKGLGKLLNRKTPISETMFDDLKKTGKFNPCKYFI